MSHLPDSQPNDKLTHYRRGKGGGKSRIKLDYPVWRFAFDMTTYEILPTSIQECFLAERERRDFPFVYIGCFDSGGFREDEAQDAIEKINRDIAKNIEKILKYGEYEFEIRLNRKYRKQYGFWSLCLNPADALEMETTIDKRPTPRKAKNSSQAKRRDKILKEAERREERLAEGKDVDPLHRPPVSKCYQEDQSEDVERQKILRGPVFWEDMVALGLLDGLPKWKLDALKAETPTRNAVIPEVVVDAAAERLEKIEKERLAKIEKQQERAMKPLGVLPHEKAVEFCKWVLKTHNIKIQCMNVGDMSMDSAMWISGATGVQLKSIKSKLGWIRRKMK